MAWDFSTDPESQRQLDRMAEKEHSQRGSVARQILRGYAAAPGGVPAKLVLEAVTPND